MSGQHRTPPNRASTFESGAPVALFPLRVAGGVVNLFRPQYDVSNDSRFLVNQFVEESTTIPITPS